MHLELEDVSKIIEKNRENILEKWVENESISTILKSITMDKSTYKKDIALSVINYLLEVVSNRQQVGDCPVMRRLVETFLDSGLRVEDVFLNCALLKNIIVETLVENDIAKEKRELVTSILDKNLHRILGIYTNKRVLRDRRCELHLKLIEEHMALSITDTKGIITHVTDAFCNLTEFSAEELLGKTHSLIRHEDMSDEFFKGMWHKIKLNKRWKGKVKNRKKHGGEFIAKTEIIPFEDENGEVFEYIAIRHDITDKELSNIDPLTNLSNRRVYLENITKILSSSDEVSIMILDIDHFKNINDTYGHSFGDLVLKEFAKILTQRVREKDLCVRWGGEEFLIVLPDISLKKASEIAERIRQKIDDLIIIDKSLDASVDIKCSIGVTQYQKFETHEEFFNRADANLYSAKNNGRNMVVVN